MTALGYGLWYRLLVFFQGDIDGFRATQMIQVKAQPAGNGMPFSRAATPDCIIWVAPCGRVVKQSLAALHFLTRTRPKLAPRVQWVLPARCALRSTASQLAEPANITLERALTVKMDGFRQTGLVGNNLILGQFSILVTKRYTEQQFHLGVDSQLRTNRVCVIAQNGLWTAGQSMRLHG